METKKYLDYEGVKHLWSKIGGKIDDATKYETVNLTITTNTGEWISTTVTVTVDGKSTNYSYNNSPITLTIEGGKLCIISFADIDSYNTPSSISYTAIPNFSRSIAVTYREKQTGIFIVDNSGELNTVSSWTGGSNATGVALINDNVSIIIAPENWYADESSVDDAWNGNVRSAWGGYNKTVTGILTTTSKSDVLTDFAGSANTDTIISQLKDITDIYDQYYTGAPAAEYCRAYSNGCKEAGQWYLPAAGEMNQIVLNKAAIEEALTAISGELFDSPEFNWTSTQYSSIYAWYYHWINEYFANNNKNNSFGVRPVCAF